MASQLNRLGAVFMAGFALIVGATGYWAFLRADELVARGDNPRRILLERRVPRGPILDRNDQVLAEAAGAPGDYTRHYPYPPLSSVLGYVSPLYGRSGLEGGFDPVLHGDEGYDEVELWRLETLLGSPPPGRGVRLTLDLDVQRAADTALGARPGAVVVLNSETGEILALASHPTFDANRLEDTWTDLVADPASPLLNRAVLGLYPPGGALAPAVLARALAAGQAEMDAPADTGPVALNGTEVTCRESERGETLAEALTAGCPAPLAALGAELGSEVLLDLFRGLRLYEAPAIGVPAGAATEAAISDPALAALGQGDLAISPLQMALVTAAVAEAGVLPAPRLVLAKQDRGGSWRPLTAVGSPTPALPAEAASEVAAWMGEAGYGASAVSGEDGQHVAWYAAFSPAADAKHVVVVLLEAGDVEAAEAVGREVMEAVER